MGILLKISRGWKIGEACVFSPLPHQNYISPNLFLLVAFFFFLIAFLGVIMPFFFFFAILLFFFSFIFLFLFWGLTRLEFFFYLFFFVCMIFYFLINLGDCPFLVFCLFFFNWTLFFNKGIWVNLYTHFFPFLHFFTPTKHKEGKLKSLLFSHFSIPSQSSTLLLFHFPNQTDTKVNYNPILEKSTLHTSINSKSR